MRAFILGLLVGCPMSLYEIHERFSSGLAHIYAASYGSIHRALKQLLAQGEIEKQWEPSPTRNRVRYVATHQGRESWVTWMRSPSTAEDVEIAALSRVFLLGLIDSHADRRAILDSLHALATEQHAALARLDSDERQQQGDRVSARYSLATLEYGISASEGLMRWLSELSALESQESEKGEES